MRVPEAERTRRRAVEYFEQSLGAAHPQTVAQRLRLGRRLMEQANPGEALPVLHDVFVAAEQGAQISESVVHEAQVWTALAHIKLTDYVLADSLLASLRAAQSAGMLSTENQMLRRVVDSTRSAGIR